MVKNTKLSIFLASNELNLIKINTWDNWYVFETYIEHIFKSVAFFLHQSLDSCELPLFQKLCKNSFSEWKKRIGSLIFVLLSDWVLTCEIKSLPHKQIIPWSQKCTQAIWSFNKNQQKSSSFSRHSITLLILHLFSKIKKNLNGVIVRI